MDPVLRHHYRNIAEGKAVQKTAVAACLGRV